jgi:hypothetical protein
MERAGLPLYSQVFCLSYFSFVYCHLRTKTEPAQGIADSWPAVSG